MLRVALTGNIASGKSTVQKLLEEKGYKVLDTDKVGHKLLENLDEIKIAFRDFDVFCDGKISREELGKLVFTHPELKQKLEEIMHPAIRKEILKFFEQNKSETLVFVGIPLLFESNMSNLFDKSLLIYTNDTLREERLISRNHYSGDYAKLRMKSQMSQDLKLNLCDFVIYNNGTLSDLKSAVDEFLLKV